MKKTAKTLFMLLLLSIPTAIFAQQPTPEFFRKNPDCMGGIYYSYHYEESELTPVPKGFKPIYISHFGRHGSRWHASTSSYLYPQEVLNFAAKHGWLTPYGESLQKTVDGVYSRAHGRTGELSQQGIDEQRGIAERMYRSYPSLFKGKGIRIESRSSSVPRCILSMAAFNERLKELNPYLQINRTTNQRCQQYMIPSQGRKNISLDVKKVTRPEMVKAAKMVGEEIVGKIFTCDFQRIADSTFISLSQFTRALYDVVSTMQDTEGDLRLDDVFTTEQRMSIWEKVNVDRYASFGPSLQWGDATLYDATFTLEEIVRDADEFLAEGGRTAFLRFGHDVTVIAALAAMQVEGKCVRTDDFDNLKDVWTDFSISPMAANLQFIFYRNKAGDVIVKLLHNEKECRLPIESDMAPYYRWDNLREFISKRIAEIRSTPMAEQLRRNSAEIEVISYHKAMQKRKAKADSETDKSRVDR